MENLTTFYILMAFIFGSIIGSFLNVVILRLPNGEKLNGRSHCTFCNHNLAVLDLFPIFSYLLLFGKCRYCGKKISPRYFIIEFITGLLFALAIVHINPMHLTDIALILKYFLVIATLIVVFVVDLEHYLILDAVIFPSLLGLMLVNIVLDIFAKHFVFGLHSVFVSGLAGSIAAAAPFFAIWYFSDGKWMGFGDVKLALFLGAALGLPQVFVALLLAVLLGGFISAILLVLTSKTLKSRLPFGTFLSIGAILCLFYGEKILSWYLAFLGF